jgi:hypothetical protein
VSTIDPFRLCLGCAFAPNHNGMLLTAGSGPAVLPDARFVVADGRHARERER